MAADPPRLRKATATRQRGQRTGYTTGANAAAAAVAATLGLLRGRVPDEVFCRLPNDQEIAFSICEGELDGDTARAVSIKDAGDDPDVTHGARLTATVRRVADGRSEVRLGGGPGVGTVTREGLGLAVGSPAINPVPRRNILDNVRRQGAALLASGDSLDVTIAAPGAEEIALRTLNPRLGILGGISILGTTGIVRPYSTAAFRASVIQGIEVAARQGQRSVVFTTGGRSEKFAMRQLPTLADACFVQMGDFIKAAFQTAIRQHMQHIYIGAMVGKLTKMAQGLAVTHAWKEAVDRDILANCASAVGASAELIAEIRAAETARFAAERLTQEGRHVAFHRELARRAMHSLRDCYPGPYQLSVLVCDFDGQLITRVEENDCDGA
ncbi:cobalt-precorrin-5B (C(1))-methyltransferase [Rhodocyclus tenuis]|uniref:Cobalt-precorrin-5B C(1)-methyltransferase n=1 Tax=Rhodocyclus gracilis TaxID=2929842 RepID=A0ABX0WIZ1_9RHOO|nr:cobalt-precorrin-5B (C(1))-methyltransferase [Rhodocyclus gracilis]NJA89680.1 cobalt-precorrin-5B (C(1))-methyltransferase [Rhodocyclus gracilis]